MKLSAIVILIFVALGAVGFWVLDSGLSGGSASNPMFPLGLAAVCFVCVVSVAFGDNFLASMVGKGAAVSPLFLLGYCAIESHQYNNRPEILQARDIKYNVICVLHKLNIDPSNSNYIKYRLGIMGKFESSSVFYQQEIEAYLGIEIGDGCRYDITRSNGGRVPPPGTPLPNITPVSGS